MFEKLLVEKILLKMSLVQPISLDIDNSGCEMYKYPVASAPHSDFQLIYK